MSDMNTKDVQYRFGTESIKDDDSSEYGLHVVNFYGEESISRPYWFRLNLTSRDPNLCEPVAFRTVFVMASVFLNLPDPLFPCFLFGS